LKERKPHSRGRERAGEVERELGEQVKGRGREREEKINLSGEKAKERDGLYMGTNFFT
jgi:hypothetical protein